MRLMIPIFFVAALVAPALSAQTLERIRDTGELHLGYRVDAAPMSYRTEAGSPAGYTPQICARVAQGIANALQLEALNVSFDPVDTTNRFDAVVNGDVDLLCGAATITMTRRQKVDFSIPVFVDGTALILPVAASEQFEDLAGRKLGVRRDTTTEDALVNSLIAAGMLAEVVRFDSHALGMAAMESGEIDAYFADQSILVGLYVNSPKSAEFKVSAEILTVEKQGLAMARGDTEFRHLVDSVLSRMYATGEMQKVLTDAIPDFTPGAALQAMYLLAPVPE